jgi:cell division protein FtsB
MAKTQFITSPQSRIPPKRILGAALSLLILILLLASVVRLGEKYFAVRTRNKELSEETGALQQKSADLSATNAYLSSSQGTEASLRQQYNYVKPGEGMIIVTPAVPASAPVASQSGIVRWWNGLFH